MRTLHARVKRDIGLDISFSIIGRARHKAVEIIEGTYASQYSKLCEYCEEVKQANVGSTMMMKLEPPYFQRLYVYLDGCKKKKKDFLLVVLMDAI